MVNNAWTFGGGANTSITIRGGVFDTVTQQTVIQPGTLLLSGTFGGAQVVPVFNLPGINFSIIGAWFQDWKNPLLLELFGLAGPELWNGAFNLSLNLANLPDNAFRSSAVYSGDLVNTPVPIPPSALLLGSGILGLVALGWRRGRKED